MPLVSQALRGVVKVKQYNPRFEDGFVLGRDYDPDKVRAEERKWKRRVRWGARGGRGSWVHSRGLGHKCCRVAGRGIGFRV